MESFSLSVPLQVKEDPPPLPDENRSSKKVKTGNEGTNIEADMDIDDQQTTDNNSHPLPKPVPSFKDMLVDQTSSLNQPEEELEFEEGDVTYSLQDGIPSVVFSEQIKELLDRTMKYLVVVKLLGRRIRHVTLRDKLPYIWPTIGPYRLIDCARDCFIVKFSSAHDYNMALLNGPWMIFGHYLSVQPWSSDFFPLDHTVNQVIGWVRLPMLPVRYYNKHIVRAISQLIGKVIKIDYNTEAGERGRFARFAVLIDLEKPLISKIHVNGKIIFIEYEGLPTICYHCGIYGHLEEVCPKKRAPNSPEVVANTPQSKSSETAARE